MPTTGLNRVRATSACRPGTCPARPPTGITNMLLFMHKDDWVDGRIRQTLRLYEKVVAEGFPGKRREMLAEHSVDDLIGGSGLGL